MAVNTKQIGVDLTQNAAPFTPVDRTCGDFISGQGWRALGNCNGSGSLQVIAVTPAYPIAYNQRIIGLKVAGAYSGPRGTLNGLIGLTDSINTAFGKIIPNLGGGWEIAIDVDSGGYGIQSPIIFGASAVADGGVTLTANSLLITVLEDDTIDPNTPPQSGNGAPPQVEGVDCNVEIKYQYGIGPSCTGEGATIAIRSGLNPQGNFISCIFTPAVDIKFLYMDKWDYTAIRADPYFIVEDPLGTPAYNFGVRSYRSPVDIQIPLKVSKLEIFGPISGESFIAYIKISKEYTPATPQGQPVGGELVDTTPALDRIRQAIIDTSGTLDADFNDKFQQAVAGASKIGETLDDKLFTPIDFLIHQLPNNLLGVLTGNVALPQGIAQTLSTALKNIIIAIILNIEEHLQLVWQTITKQINDNVSNASNPVTITVQRQGEVIDRLLAGNYNEASDFYAALKSAGNNVSLLFFLQNAFALFFGTIYFLKAKIDVAAIQIKYLLFGQYKPVIPDISVLINAYRRGQLEKTVLQSNAHKLGFTNDKIDDFLAATEIILNQEQIKELFLKGIITELQHDNFLFRIGVSYDNAQLLRKNYQIMLNGSDVTRIADKHIYSNDIPSIFGQYSEIDQGYIDAMAKIGISPEQTRLLWAAHWSLPSFEQAFDMWHRGDINDDQLNTFFALTDIMPFFREKLKNLSHNLIGRVDIRRFFSVGVYNQEKVYQAYKKLGYSDEDAKAQTDFTVIHERLSEEPAQVRIRNLTETMVIKAYKRGIINESDAIARLGKVGYLPTDASLILRLETQIDGASIAADKTQHYHDRAINLIISSVAEGVISDTEARNYLTALGVPNVEINSELVYADIERITRIKKTVISHIKTAYTQGMIDDNQARSVMLSKGFSSGEVELLLDELSILVDLRNKPLTEKQIAELAKDKIIDQTTTQFELHNIGYTDQHVQWLTEQIFKE